MIKKCDRLHKYFVGFIFWAISFVAVNCYGAFKLGGGYVIGELSTSLDYTTNVESNSSAEDDFIYQITPSLNYATYGAVVETKVSAGVGITQYERLDDNNSENFNFSLRTSFPNGMETPYAFILGLSTREQASASTEFGQIITTRTYDATAGVSYKLNSRYSILSGLDFNILQVDNEEQRDTDSITIPLSFSYIYSQNFRYGLGYRYRKQEVNNGGISSTDHALFAQASGQFLPLVDGSLSLGTQIRSSQGDTQSEEIAPYISGNLSWKATSLTSYSFTLSADFQTSTGNRSTRGYSAEISANHNFKANLKGTASISWENTDFSEEDLSGNGTRSDDNWSFGVNLNSTIAENIGLRLGLDYTINRSTTGSADFEKLVISLQANHAF